MVDDHENFVGDSQRRLLLADTHFETPKGASEEGGRFPGAPGTLHQDPAQGAIPLARFAAVPFAGTLMVPGTYSGPRRQARGVPKAAHIGANLGEHVPCRNDIDPRNALELRNLCLSGGEQRPMMVRELAREGAFQLRTLVLQGPERQRR
jgi:hypothetical protein